MTATCDVIVVGGGGAALAAAASAAALGRQVTLLEKNAKLGGSTSWSVGSVSASNTPHQRREGIQDSPNEHFEDLGKFIGSLESRDNLALRRVLVDNITETFDWLLSSGLVFLGPTPEPPHRVPRMHNVVPNSKAFPFQLGRLCRKLGVEIRLSTRAEKFIVEDGRVVGVEAMDSRGVMQKLRARRGVVLATGDFSASRTMKQQYASEVAAKSVPVNGTNTGDGHLMALEIGASIVNGDLVHGPLLRFVPPTKPAFLARIPPYRIVGALATWAMRSLPRPVVRPLLMSFITTALGPDLALFRAGARLINSSGEAFCDELAMPAHALAEQAEGTGYIVMDGRIAKQFDAWPHFVSTAPTVAHAYLADYKRNRRDIYHQANDIAALSSMIGVNADALLQAMSKSIVGRPALSEPPFIALGPVRSYVVLTEGGLRVNDSHQVLNQRGSPIAGLFAAGATGQGGVLLYGHGHHLAWTFVSGRRAGKHAALLPPV